MKWTFVISLVQNVAILLSFTLLYDYFWLRVKRSKTIITQIIVGIIIGGITLVIMLTPSIVAPGLVFDTRSVILSVSGLFFGAIPTLVAMSIASVYRIILGGEGVYMGVAVIITSGIIGILWKHLRPSWRDKRFVSNLLLLGVVVHVVMLSCTLLLPEDSALPTIKAIAIPLIVIYIPATILIGWFMVKQEINKKNLRVNEKLVESERRFTEMLANVQLVSVILDNDGHLIFCNEYLLKMTGYRFYEVVGKSWVDIFVHRDKKSEIRKNIEQHNVSNYHENQILTKKGELIDVFWSNVLLKDENGEVTGIASIGENITERKLTEENLLASKEKAEESDRLKTIFLSNMSHEIRTPLNAIVGFSELMADDTISNDVKAEYYEIIKRSGNKLIQIINDILDVSKLETKQFKIYKTNCSLKEIMNNIFSSFKESEELKNKESVKFVMDFQDYLHNFEFESDPNRIEQVLDNLIANAIKYTDKGSIEFGVSTNLSDGIQVLEFYVKDTGIGIPNTMFETIFERFRQVEENGFHQGSGIGLSICKGILDLLGGRIWVDSKMGVGSKFSFSVPYLTNIENIPYVKIIENVNLEIINKKVIIAEDDNNSFFYLNALLKGHNLDVIHAASGDALMKMLETVTPDLILLDLNMPGKTGYMCLDEIKEKGIVTKIIAQTAYAGMDERDKCIQNGCSEFISKPIKRNELYSVINKIMS